MNTSRRRILSKNCRPLLLSGLLVLTQAACNGKAIGFHPAPGFTGKPAVSSSRDPASGPPKALFKVTQIIEAPTYGGIPGYTGTLPFPEPVIRLGDPFRADRQTHFDFSFTYPPNNFQLAEARLVIDTMRDTSDTEGIFVDGVLSGRPPSVNAASPYILYRRDYSSSAPQKNLHYINYSLAHYKAFERNTFDLSIADLLTYTPLTPYSVLSDNYLPVITADDSPVYQAYLVMKGYTVSDRALRCVNSPTYTFENVFLHNDGNSIGTPAFSGTVRSPYASWNLARDAFQSAEFFFDAQWPKVDERNVTVTNARIRVRVKRSAIGKSAVVINGVGVSEPGFDRSTAGAVVEEWIGGASATNAFSAFLAGIPANESSVNVELDLVALLGAAKVRSLIAQGKLNISLAGAVAVVYGQAATSARGFTAPVAGPELVLVGEYFTELCDVPNDPKSPLSGSSPVAPTVNDGTGPVITSLTIVEVTSNSAKVMWLTDEPATSQVKYGLFDLDQQSPQESTLKTFHSVTLTGLLPYKWYFVEVISRDGFGNTSQPLDETIPFRTLR